MTQRGETEPSDPQLIAAILALDSPAAAEEAYRVLVRRYWKVLVVSLRARLASERDTEDLAQEAFLRAFRSLPRLENRELFLAWLLRIAQNLATDHLRRRRPETSLQALGFDSAELGDDKGGAARSVEKQLEDREEMVLVLNTLEQLPERYRTVVILRYLKGLSNQEMARKLGEPEGTIRNRLFRALGKLREQIETAGKQNASRP